jgi:cold shock CspA family protein
MSAMQRKGKGKGRSKPKIVPKDFTFDAEARYTGKVVEYLRTKGFGFVEPDEKDIVPDDKIFVYWKDIKSEDRCPFLKKDQEVEFGIAKKREFGGKSSIRAKEVSLPGGGEISLQEEEDAKREFIGSQSQRYTGNLKFFDPGPGFGYIVLDKDQGLPDQVPAELRVEISEVNTGGSAPKIMRNVSVECGIWVNEKGKHRAYNMTTVGGEAISREKVENRSEEADGQEFNGTVQVWSGKFGWGFILPEEGTQFPGPVKKKIAQMNKDTRKKGKEVKHSGVLYFRRSDCRDYKPEQGDEVSFQVYTDDKGAGAFAVHD